MNNDRVKQVIKSNLGYYAAIKLWQQCNAQGISFCEYESI
jgi:hypothetical protein